MWLKPDAEKASQKIYLQDEYSAKNLAAPLAECNDIVKEEFEYQPGADLSRRRFGTWPTNSRHITKALSGRGTLLMMKLAACLRVLSEVFYRKMGYTTFSRRLGMSGNAF